MLYFPHCCTWLALFVTRTACMMNSSFWRPHSGRTAIATGRFLGLSILLWGLFCQWQSGFRHFPTLFWVDPRPH
jgi:hypothetical protein